jgi:iron complex outermembrane recepter protein
MPLRASFTLLMLICLYAAGGVSSRAWAQGAATGATSGTADSGSADNGEVQEVVVTAQRRQEREQDVPISIQAFTPSEIQAAQVWDTQDLSILTPGLIIGNNVGYVTPFLRGVGTVAEGPGVESPVALYVDGVYYGSLVGSILSLTSINEIEVDKGPQGTLFGRNATGGAIQINTKDPAPNFEGYADATYGNYETTGSELYVTAPVTGDLATNLAVYWLHQNEGFGTNLYNGLQVGQSHDLVLRNKWLLSSSDRTQVKVTFDYELTDYVPNMSPALGTLPLGPPPYQIPPQDIAGFYQPYGRTELGGMSVQVHHDLAFAQFVSISAYRYTDNDAQGENIFTINPLYSVSADVPERHDQYTQEFQLISPSGGWVQWTTGVYLLYSDNRFPQPGVFVTGALVAPLESLSFASRTRIYAGAPYGQATFKLAPATDLTLGFRYTKEKHDFRIEQTYAFPPALGPPAITEAAATESFDKPTWRIALDHHFTPDLMGYISYNRGFKSGGFNDTLIPVIPYLPETIDAFEGGTKATLLDHHLVFDWSAFLYNYKNVQEISYALSSATPVIYNGASARTYGLDIDTTWNVFEGLSVVGSMEYLHAKFTSFPNAPISSPAPGGGTNYVEGSVAGNWLPFAPRWSFSLSPQYVIPLSARGELTISATYAFNDGYFAEPDNRLHQSPYNLLNAQLAWYSPSKDWNVRLWGRNLNNAVYASYILSGSTGDNAQFAPPRTYGVTVTRNF